MTSPAGNSEFCVPSTSVFDSGNIEGVGDSKLTVSLGVSEWVPVVPICFNLF